MGTPIARKARDLVSAASRALSDRVEEVNRLNVFPVPDGDTGTNMSLTMSTVVEEVSKLPDTATIGAVCHAVTHGSLMGARGNSGVILSQILRGLCEGIGDASEFTTELVASSVERSRDVAYQAVRKPVEGTMLTVVADVAVAARACADDGLTLPVTLESLAAAAYRSVQRTPELLPVLKENNVVDAGGFGLAILIEGFAAALAGHEVVLADSASTGVATLSVEPVDDWDDDEYLYCTEFLLFGEGVDRDAVASYVASVGGSELVVGDAGEYKVHVHTNDPGAVLSMVTSMGEVGSVHINNMRRQTAQRDERLRSALGTGARAAATLKPLGFVAVAAGDGVGEIFRSLGVDVVVSGGQTMNPSTADIVDAIDRCNARKVVVLPNNKNILMAANAAATVSDREVFVVPTRSVPQGFAAVLAWGGGDDIEDDLDEMSRAASRVRTAEVTVAVKDAVGSAGAIRAGQVIGVIDGEEIAVVGEDVIDVAARAADLISGDGAETLTVLAGEDFSDSQLARLVDVLRRSHPDLEVESHRGGQPLYPVILSAE